jgi:hypothetical protein
MDPDRTKAILLSGSVDGKCALNLKTNGKTALITFLLNSTQRKRGYQRDLTRKMTYSMPYCLKLTVETRDTSSKLVARAVSAKNTVPQHLTLLRSIMIPPNNNRWKAVGLLV